MITNRPTPPKRIFSGNEYDTAANVYTYFATEETGLTIYDCTTAAAYENVFLEVGVAGYINYLTICCDNDSGSAADFGARLIVDENIVWNYRTISCAATSETGFSLAGYWLWDTTNDEPYCQCADRNMVFRQSIRLDIYASTLTSVDVLAAYKYKIANRIGV